MSDVFGGNVLREYVEHAEALDKGRLPMPSRVLVIEFFEGEGALPVPRFFGMPTESREEAISLFGEALITLGEAIQSVNAEGAN